MKGELTKTDVNGCTSLQDILKAMDLAEPEPDHEYDIVLATEEDDKFNEEDEPIEGIKFMSTSHLNY